MGKHAANQVYIQPPNPPASGFRGTMDSLVHGSLVDLFGAYSVAVAPLPRSARLQSPCLPDISASVGFTRRGALNPNGRLTLSLSTTLLEAMSPTNASHLKADWARELANQLLGRIKNRLLPFNIRLQLGMSALVDSSKLERQLRGSLDARIYTGRTLRGETVATFEGLPEDSELSYGGYVKTACEGDTILF
jgi:hypothetical protein